jgi:AcrR family transcriptional regulator
MRDVAAHAGVALGTIYRYFASKDHLLAACQVELWKEQARRFALRPPSGDTSSERVLSLLGRAMRGTEREPRRSSALITASSSADPAVRECQSEITAIMDVVLADAMGDVEPERRVQIARVLRRVWFACLLGWVNGWSDTATVNRELEAATRLLLG